jgi:ubiquinone/menaquinone biosynthesis C-methylase UbiE
MQANREAEHDSVYGKTFALYNANDIEEFIEPLRVRFAKNHVDPAATFTGKLCLDAGCGGGRGSIFMLANGAACVQCVDVSATNIETTTRNLRDRSLNNFEAHLGTLERLPFADQTFDFVWCNGVLQHAAVPGACLAELARVLKVGGSAWIYVYGAGGLYWWCVDQFRRWVADVPAQTCISALRLMRYSPRYIAEYLDDWKVAYLRTYTGREMVANLMALGFDTPRRLPFGMSYDTCQRRENHRSEASWVGEGDLRYLVAKTRHIDDVKSELVAASTDDFSPEIKNMFGATFLEIERAVIGRPMMMIAAAASLQYRLREIMSDEGPLDITGFAAAAAEVLQDCQVAIGAA